MAQKNDERIMQLKKQIDQKKMELSEQSLKFSPKTNCLLVLDKITYNLHIDGSEMLLLKVNMLDMSAKNLGLNPDDVIISGYSLSDWIEDIRGFVKIKKYKKQEKELKETEKKLDDLLSEDKRTELELDVIAAMLN